jgi:hypothetical protein
MSDSTSHVSPRTPNYAQNADYVENKGGSSFGDNINTHFIRFMGEGKDVEVVGDNEEITVDKAETSIRKTFTVRYDALLDLAINYLNLNPSTIQLRGSTVSSVTLAWQYNQPIDLQTLHVAGVETVMSPALLGNNAYNATLSGLSLTSNTSFKITGQRGSKVADRTSTLYFGNRFYQGKTSLQWSGVPGTFVANFIPGALTQLVRAGSDITFSTLSGEGEWDWVAIPLGVLGQGSVVFKDRENINPGGFVSIGTVNIPNGTAGDPNDLYTVYISINRNIGGAIFDIT